MEITIKTTIAQTQNVQLPLFFVNADGDSYIGIFNEMDLRIVNQNKYLNGTTIVKTNMQKSDAWTDWQKWLDPQYFTPISEQEFIVEWNAVLKSLSFQTLSKDIAY